MRPSWPRRSRCGPTKPGRTNSPGRRIPATRPTSGTAASSPSPETGWWPMHQTDTLFHKSKGTMAFIFGGEADNHAVNTVPKETLVKITKAEDGGIGGKGLWAPARTGFSPGREGDFMKRYLAGTLVKVTKR